MFDILFCWIIDDFNWDIESNYESDGKSLNDKENKRRNLNNYY